MVLKLNKVCLTRATSDGDPKPEREMDNFQISLDICSSEINFKPECFTPQSPDTEWRPHPPLKRAPPKMTQDSNFYSLTAPRQKPMGPRIPVEPKGKLRPATPPPRPKLMGPRAFVSRRESLPTFPEKEKEKEKASANENENANVNELEKKKVTKSARRSRFRLMRPNSLMDASPRHTRTEPFSPTVHEPPPKLPLEALFRESSALLECEDNDILRRFFDVLPQDKGDPQSHNLVQRSHSEELPRYHPGSGLTHRNSSPTPPLVEHKALRGLLSSKPNAVGGLINKVKAHTAQKLPLGAAIEGGAPDRRLGKVLANLTFVQHVAQIELSELRLATPWFMKLSGNGEESPEPSSTPYSHPPSNPAKEERKEPTKDEAARRWHLACEMTDTEANYLNHLQTTLSLFRDPLLVSPCPVPANAILGIFGHHERLVALAEGVKAALSAITHPDSWDPTTSCIGPVFLSRTRFFRAYLDYIQGYLAAVDLVQRWEAASPAFRAVTSKGAANNPARQTLKEMLILPVQRLARYSLLLQTLRKLTPTDHKDHPSLTEAVEQMSALALEANEARRAEEESAAARAIYASVDNCPTMLRNAGFKRVFMSEAQELRSRRRLRLFVYPGFIMVTVARRNWGIHQTPNQSPKPARPKWKFLQLLPLALLDLVQVMDGSRPADVCLLVYNPEPTSPPSSPSNADNPPPATRYYLLQHADRRSHQEFTHILKLHLRTLTCPSPFDPPSPNQPPVYSPVKAIV